jgi:di/tricarboxylate transporter
VSLHVIGVIGLVVVFVIGTLRPVSLGALALVMTFLVGTFAVGEAPKEMYSGFPVDLLVLLVGVTYLFGIATKNGTVERIIEGAARLTGNRRSVIPWAVFVVASLPGMAGALGSAGVALLAPLSLRLAERYDIDRRMIGLMVVHGAAAGNFSPLNVLTAIVTRAVAAAGLEMSVATLFIGNLAYNVVLAVIIFVMFGGLRLGRALALEDQRELHTAANVARPGSQGRDDSWTLAQVSTLVALAAVAVAAFVFGFAIGFVALAAAVTLHLVFPSSSDGAEKNIAWGVVLLVCGIVTYVAALQRYGTVDAVGASIAGLGSPLLVGLLICAVAAITSAFASSAGILGAMVPLATPVIIQGDLGATGLIVALAISATVVDSTPFSTVGALVVANAADDERVAIYRGLLKWGAVMVLTAPVITWLVFVLFRT